MSPEQEARVDALLSHRVAPAPASAARVRRPPNDAVVILRIPEAVREQVALAAYSRGVSLSEAMRQAAVMWLDSFNADAAELQERQDA